MKKILKLVFILSLLTLALVACKKDKQNQQNDAGQAETSQGYDEYQQVLYVNEAKFNISGDMVVLFSEELDKNQDFKKLVEVEGLDGDITIMPFLNKLIIKIIRKEDEKINFDYYENNLFKELNSLRKEISKEENIAPYIIFSDMTLIEMAEKKPTNRWEMLKIKGIGNQKFTNYGERFLERINAYNMEEKK